MSRHASLADSLRAYGTGGVDPILVTRTLAWIHEAALRSPP
jgi:hypothetical protein